MSEGEENQERHGVEKSDGKHFKGAEVLKEGGDSSKISRKSKEDTSMPFLLILLLILCVGETKQPLLEKVAGEA